LIEIKNKRTGKGGLSSCPNCKQPLENIEDSFVDNDTHIIYYTCFKCDKKYSELWNCKNWEEE